MYRPDFHLTPPSGWLNDPNGFCFYDGKYHLFYQHNPKAPKWGRMFWGHAVSSDLIKWEHLEIALKPESFWENLLGCFSGSAVIDNGELNLIYTGFSILGQYQLRARSSDGISFTRHSRPVIGPGNLPQRGDPFNFRDPKVFERKGSFYLIAGSSHQHGFRSGTQIVLYSSDDLDNWVFRGSLLKDRFRRGGIFECPDYINSNGKDIIIASPMFLEANEEREFENLHSAVYIPGKLDLQKHSFIPDTPGRDGYRELDAGTDFYAPQTMTAPDGRIIMTAWMNMWRRSNPTEPEGWAGMMTIPRELSFEDGLLIQRPVGELDNYRRNLRSYKNFAVGKRLSLPDFFGNRTDLNIEADLSNAADFGIRFFVSEDRRNYAELYFDKRKQIMVFDRSQTAVRVKSLSRAEKQCDRRTTKLKLSESKLQIRVIMDRISLEVFINGGRCSLSSLIYNGDNDRGIEFFSEGRAVVTQLKIYDIEV